MRKYKIHKAKLSKLKKVDWSTKMLVSVSLLAISVASVSSIVSSVNNRGVEHVEIVGQVDVPYKQGISFATAPLNEEDDVKAEIVKNNDYLVASAEESTETIETVETTEESTVEQTEEYKRAVARNEEQKEVDERLVKEAAEKYSEPVDVANTFGEPTKIRCTTYCDYGYTKSGQYVREGILAGKKEWLGKHAVLYKVNSDGSIGDIIGYYEFLDTGYGISGSLINGKSIDLWQPSESACWNWIAEHGDYVYMQMTD